MYTCLYIYIYIYIYISVYIHIYIHNNSNHMQVLTLNHEHAKRFRAMKLDNQTMQAYNRDSSFKNRMAIRSKQRDPNPKEASLAGKETSTRKRLHSTFAALPINQFFLGLVRATQVRAYDDRAIGSFVRNSYVSALCPVVICPYLCRSELGSLCLHMYICMYVYVCMYIYIYIYTYTYTYRHLCMYVCIYIYIYTHIYS